MKISPAKKLFLLLLILLLTASTSSAADNSTASEGTWKYGKISGQLRTYYFLQENSAPGQSFEKNRESFALGGQLKYETPWLADHFGGAVNAFLAVPLFDGLNRERYAGGGVLDNRNQGYAVIGEAYFKARYAKTEARVYRQRIDTPFINSNDSRLLPATFEAYGLKSSDIDNLQLNAFWVDKIKERDSDVFISMTKAAGVQGSEGGTLMLGADWKPLQKTDLRAWNYYTPDMENLFYLEMKHSFELSEALESHLRFQGINQQNTGENLLGSFNTMQGALLWGVKFNGLTLDLGGSITEDTDAVRTSWGVNTFFTHFMLSDFNRAGEKALYFALSYDFGRIGIDGFTAGIKTGYGESPKSSADDKGDRSEYDLKLHYAFAGELKGLSLTSQFAYLDADRSRGGTDKYQVRMKMQYDF